MPSCYLIWQLKLPLKILIYSNRLFVLVITHRVPLTPKLMWRIARIYCFAFSQTKQVVSGDHILAIDGQLLDGADYLM